MTAQKISIDLEILDQLKAHKPRWHSLVGFTNDCLKGYIEQVLSPVDTVPTLGKPSSSLSSLREREVLPSKSLEEEERVRALSLEGLPIPPAAEKVIDPALEAHSLLIRDFWKTKKGSKGDRAWSLLQTGLKAIQEKYGDDVVQEQLEQGINARWNGISLKNYESWEAKRSHRPSGERVYTDEDWARLDTVKTPW